MGAERQGPTMLVGMDAHTRRREFVESASKDVYGHLPPAQGGLQTGAQPASA